VLACSATIDSTPADGRARSSTGRTATQANREVSASAAQPSTMPPPTSAVISSRAMLKNATGGITP
jgi:hypothetical protein